MDILRQKHFKISDQSVEELDSYVKIKVLTTQINFILRCFSLKKYSLDISNSTESTIFVDIDHGNLQDLINLKAFVFINVNVKYESGYQCFAQNKTQIIDFVRKYVEHSIAFPINSVAPYDLINKKYGPKGYLQKTKFTKAELNDFINSPDPMRDLREFIQEYHITGKLSNVMISKGKEIRDHLGKNEDIVKSILNAKDPDGYDMVVETMISSAPANYLKECNTILYTFELFDNDNTSIITVAQMDPIEQWDLDDTLTGSLEFFQMVEINLYGFKYLLYNTTFADINLPNYINWLKEDQAVEYFGINFVNEGPFYRIILVAPGKIMVITSVPPQQTSNKEIFQNFLVNNKFIYNNQSLLQFIPNKFEVDITGNSYDYINLCFNAYGIPFQSDYYLNQEKRNIPAFSHIYKTSKSILLGNASYNVFDYESFQEALRRHHDLFTTFESFIH